MSTMIVVGRLGGDAELRSTQGGTQVAGFSIADDIGWGDKKTTQWIKCALFGDRAAKIAPYLTKGTTVECIGVPQVESWKDKQGEPRANIRLTVNEVKLHGGGSKDRPVADNTRAGRNDMDQDIPF